MNKHQEMIVQLTAFKTINLSRKMRDATFGDIVKAATVAVDEILKSGHLHIELLSYYVDPDRDFEGAIEYYTTDEAPRSNTGGFDGTTTS